MKEPGEEESKDKGGRSIHLWSSCKLRKLQVELHLQFTIHLLCDLVQATYPLCFTGSFANSSNNTYLIEKLWETNEGAQTSAWPRASPQKAVSKWRSPHQALDLFSLHCYILFKDFQIYSKVERMVQLTSMYLWFIHQSLIFSHIYFFFFFPWIMWI